VALARQDLGDFPIFIEFVAVATVEIQGFRGFYETYYSPDRTMEYFAMARS